MLLTEKVLSSLDECQSLMQTSNDNLCKVHNKITSMREVISVRMKPCRTYACTYFKIWELVPEDFLKKYGEEKCWLLLDSRVLWTADRLREKYGAINVNTYHISFKNSPVYGKFNESGYRAFDSRTGAALSQHKFGRALDLHPTATAVSQMIDDVKKNPTDIAFMHISAVEVEKDKKPVTWFHFDVGNRDGANDVIQLLKV